MLPGFDRKVMPRKILCLMTTVLVLAGCSAIERGSNHARETMNEVGERVEYHAAKVTRKTVSLWQRIFGGGDDSDATPRKKSPSSEPSTAPMRNYHQQYVGQDAS